MAVRPRQPEGALRRALGAHPGLPALVRPRPRHRHPRDRAMRFTFAGVEYEGREGETLAAALVRNGVRGGFRSVYRDRPRGVYSAGEEEPNALVQIGAQPMVRATQVELEEGLSAEPLAGKGRLVAAGDETRNDHFHAHCDLLVVGGGLGSRGRPRGGRADDPRPLGTALRARFRRRPARAHPDDGGRALRRQLRRRRRARPPPLAHPGEARRARDGRDRAAARLSRTTTGPGSCWPGPRAATSSAALGWSSSRTTTRRSGSRARRSSTPRGPARRRHARGGAPRGRRPRRRLEARVRRARGLGRLEPGRPPLDPARRPAALRRADGGVRPRRRAPGVEVAGKAAGAGLPDVRPLWLVPGDEAVSFVDLERDSTVADLRRAVGAGLRSVEHVKRFTTVGTGSDQGRRPA